MCHRVHLTCCNCFHIYSCKVTKDTLLCYYRMMWPLGAVTPRYIWSPFQQLCHTWWSMNILWWKDLIGTPKNVPEQDFKSLFGSPSCLCLHTEGDHGCLCFPLHLVFISIIRIHIVYIRIYSTAVALAKWYCRMPSCSWNYFISYSDLSWALVLFAWYLQIFFFSPHSSWAMCLSWVDVYRSWESLVLLERALLEMRTVSSLILLVFHGSGNQCILNAFKIPFSEHDLRNITL